MIVTAILSTGLRATKKGITTDVTSYPVTVYQYRMRRKLHIFSRPTRDGHAVPKMVWSGRRNDRKMAYLIKDDNAFRIRYQKASGDWVELPRRERHRRHERQPDVLDIYSDGMISSTTMVRCTTGVGRRTVLAGLPR